jgi:RNA polymerase sigma-70 factor (ECF subfamily)
LQATNDDPRDDQVLAALADQGDASAFEVLYWRHRDWVVNLAYRYTGDHSLALDVLQETFLYLLKKFPGFTLTCELRSFLFPAVRHLGIAARRKAGRLQSAGDDALAALPAPVPANTSDAARDELGLHSDTRR